MGPKKKVEDTREYSGTLMDRVENLVGQLEINQDERDYLRRRVEILAGAVDRGKRLKYLARVVSERVLREVTLHHHNCPYNDSIFLAVRAGMVWHRLHDCQHSRNSCMINTCRNGGLAWIVLVVFFHLSLGNVVRHHTRFFRSSMLLLVIRTHRPARSLHLNPRTDGTGWFVFSPFLRVKLTLSTWVSGWHVSPRLPLWYSREGFTATWPTRVLWKQLASVSGGFECLGFWARLIFH